MAPPGSTTIESPRRIVCDRLLAQIRRFPDLDIAPLKTESLDQRDGALAHAIYGTVLRRWLTIQTVLERSSGREFRQIEPHARAALLAGAAQLLFLDRVPPHAAVSEAVGWMKSRRRQRGSGFVNAVLRRVSDAVSERVQAGATTRAAGPGALPRDLLPLADGSALRLREELLPDDALARLSVATSHAPALLRAWEKTLPPDRLVQRAIHSLVEPPTILNTGHAQQSLPDGLVPHHTPGHHVLSAEAGPPVEVLRGRKDIWVQDPGSAAAVQLASSLDPQLVADVCAGRGTKTRQLAALFPRARIIATDVDEKRVVALRRATEHLSNVSVVPFADLIDYSGSVDLALLDVPCSNTGVLPRRPEAKYRFSEQRLEKLVSLQRQIIADAIRLIHGGPRRGALLLSTCSLERPENEDSVKWAIRWHSLREIARSETSPAGLPGESPEAYSDGAFGVLLGS